MLEELKTVQEKIIQSQKQFKDTSAAYIRTYRVTRLLT